MQRECTLLTDGILSQRVCICSAPPLTAIHRAAGPELYEECLTVPQVERNVRCPTGEARITKSALTLPGQARSTRKGRAGQGS